MTPPVRNRLATRLPRWQWVALAGMVALGVAARLMNFRNVFTAGGVFLLPTDPYYYLRFARLQAGLFPHFRTFDPYVNVPTGADILWPPLHTWLILLASGGARPETTVAFLSPGVSLLELGALAFYAAKRFGGPVALVVTGLVALVPAAVSSGALGNPDHHVHEPWLAAMVTLAVVDALRHPGGRGAVLAGILLGAGRMLTPSAFLLLPAVALAIAFGPSIHAARTGLRVGGIAAALLTLEVLAFGAPLRLQLETLSAFQPLFGVALLAAAVAVAELRSSAPRRAWVPGLIALAGLALLAPELGRGLGQLGRVDPVLAFVTESQPLWRAPSRAFVLLGPVVWLLPAALVWLGWAGLREPAVRGAFFSALLLGALYVLQARFSQALAGAAAVACGLSLPALWRQSRLLRMSVLGISGAFLIPSLLPDASEVLSPLLTRTRPLLTWMRTNLPPASKNPYGTEAPDYAIVADLQLGHLILGWAERPVVGTLFSQAPVHLAGNARDLGVLTAESDDGAFARARETRARYVLVTPERDVPGAPGLPRGTLLLDRLFAGEALGHFRLIRETDDSFAKLFEVVEGAVLAGRCAPGAAVTASLSLTTNVGRHFEFRRTATADSSGAFELRVPYSTSGVPYRIELPQRTCAVTVDALDVEAGHLLTACP